MGESRLGFACLDSEDCLLGKEEILIKLDGRERVHPGKAEERLSEKNVFIQRLTNGGKAKRERAVRPPFGKTKGK